MGKSPSKEQIAAINLKKVETHPGHTEYEGKTPRVPKNTPITGHSNSNSKDYKQTSPMTKEEEKGKKKKKEKIVRTSVTPNSPKEPETHPVDTENKGRTPRVTKDNVEELADFTDPAITGHSKSFNSSESTNGNVQTIARVTEPAIIDNDDTGGNSENYEEKIPMAKEDEKGTKKKKKKENIFSTPVTMEPSKEETSEPMNAEYRLAQEENTDGKNEMSVTEQQVKAMMMEAKRLAERCRCDMEASNANCEELKSCPKAFIQSISSVEKYISNLILEKSKLTMEKNDYLNRFSSAAGSILTDNNPNIASLHDPNRPMKLAEKFNRIYDDQWTDMIERLEKKEPNIEEHKYKCVYHLYSVLIVIFNSLSKKAEVQLQGLAEHLFLLTKPSTEQIHATWVEYKEERVQLIASRKKTAETTISMLQQHLQADPIFIQELRKCSPHLEDVMLDEIASSEYFKNCVEICWYFVIQDPPMYVEHVSLKGTKIDKDTHKVFTKSGDIVKYHVWPALYLHHQDGNNSPLMGKGVVQPE